jgi:hypothetical protein
MADEKGSGDVHQESDVVQNFSREFARSTANVSKNSRKFA